MKVFGTLAILAWGATVDSVVEFGSSGGTASLRVKVGSQFAVRMATNPTTGFDWHELDSIPSCVSQVSRTYERSGSVMAGAPSILQLSYSAVSECEGELVFGYTRPWERNTTDDIPYVRVHVIVSDGIEL